MGFSYQCGHSAIVLTFSLEFSTKDPECSAFIKVMRRPWGWCLLNPDCCCGDRSYFHWNCLSPFDACRSVRRIGVVPIRRVVDTMVRGTLAPSQICEVLLQPTLQMLGIGPRPCSCDTSASSSSKPHRLARVCEPRSLALARGLAKFLFLCLRVNAIFLHTFRFYSPVQCSCWL